MKKAIQWSFLVSGTVIGAGYASGREIWLFFGPNSGRAIFIFSVLFALSCYSILNISFQQQSRHYQATLQVIVGKKPSNFYDLMMFVYLTMTLIVMLAGSGATLEVYQIPKWFGIGLIALMLIWAFSFSLNQIIDINTVLMPVLLLALSALLLIFLKIEPVAPLTKEYQVNYLNAITFTSVNLLPIISVTGAIGHKIKSKKEVIMASILAAITLGGLSWLFNHGLTVIESEIDLYEMPIYGILIRFPSFVLIIITIIIWIAIFATAFTSLLGLIARIQNKIKISRVKLAAIIILLILPLTLMGFQFLVERIYPLYGVLNLYILIKLIIYPLKEWINNRANVK